MNTIKISNKNIGIKSCFFIAEAGVNHNGSINLAKMVDVAKKAGADAIKFKVLKLKI